MDQRFILQKHFKIIEKEKSIHTSKWPVAEKAAKSDELDLFIEILTKVRQEKSNNKKSMKAEIVLTIDKESYNRILLIYLPQTNHSTVPLFVP